MSIQINPHIPQNTPIVISNPEPHSLVVTPSQAEIFHALAVEILTPAMDKVLKHYRQHLGLSAATARGLVSKVVVAYLEQMEENP